jgi:hypothetical protein
LFQAARWLSFATLIAGLSGCNAEFPFLPRPEVPRERIEAEVKSRLGSSQLTTFTLEKQTVAWVEQTMSARFGEPIQLSGSGEGREGHRSMWVAYLEGTIAQDFWPAYAPTTSRPGPGFSQVLMVISPEGGTPILTMAKPIALQ